MLEFFLNFRTLLYVYASLVHYSILLHIIFILQVAGAIAAGTGVLETLIKESQEEASLSEELVRQAKPTGTIR